MSTKASVQPDGPPCKILVSVAIHLSNQDPPSSEFAQVFLPGCLERRRSPARRQTPGPCRERGCSSRRWCFRWPGVKTRSKTTLEETFRIGSLKVILKVQALSVTVTVQGNRKSVTVSDCHSLQCDLIRRAFLGPKNCHCSRIIPLTGVTVTGPEAVSKLGAISSLARNGRNERMKFSY